MSAKLRALGIDSEIIVIPNTPHPFWLFHPWFEPTVQHVDDFLRRTMKPNRHQVANDSGASRR
jgi:hypothetical protein